MVEPQKQIQSKTIADGWYKTNKQFETAGVQPHTCVLDNEVSNTLNKAFKKYTIDYQLVPPHSHNTNKAECDIQIFKEHFKAVLDTLDPYFPISHWGILLPQSVTTLNMLRASWLNPKISAYTYIFGKYDFNATPIAPPGKKLVVHSNPYQHLTWYFKR